MAMRTRRAVSVWLPRWPIERLARTPDGLPPEPAVIAARDGQRRLVACTDAKAATLGIRPGMTVALAQASVPGLTICDADPQADEAALHRLALWALRYTPVSAPNGKDGLLLDIAGASHLMGGEEALIADLKERLSGAGLTARIGLADTPAAARGLARHAQASPAISAKGAVMADTRTLPAAALGLSPRLNAALSRMGLSTIGEIRRVPRASLAARFGRQVTDALDLMDGTRFEAIEPVLPPHIPTIRLPLVEPLIHAHGVEAVLGRAAEELCRLMDKTALGARLVDFHLHRVDGGTLSLRAGTSAASRDPSHLARLFKDRLDALDLGFGIDAVSLCAPRTERMTARQLGTAGGGGHESTKDLAPLVDRIAARIGATGVYRLAPTESDMPERAMRRIAPLSPPTGARWDRAPRPVRLISPPAPARVVALLPDHPPAQFSWREGRHRFRRADGPECVLGEWWLSEEETALTRDYYRVEDEEGRRYWLFRARDEAAGTARWFVHGVFA
jgi:protein ImuB